VSWLHSPHFGTLAAEVSVKRRLLLRLVLVGCFGVVAFALFLWWRAPAISSDSFEKIKPGMSKTEVISILNGRPHYGPGKSNGMGMPVFLTSTKGHVWESADIRIYVVFDNEDYVSTKMCIHFLNESFLQKLRRWLRLN
jgi:hypothetical protein